MTESDAAFYKWWGSGRDGASTEYPLDLSRVTWQASRQQALEEKNDGPGSPLMRYRLLMAELEKRFPHPEPFSSVEPSELHYLRAIDALAPTGEKA